MQLGNLLRRVTVPISSFALPTYLFTLSATLDTCLKRDAQRENQYGKDAVTAVYNLVSLYSVGELIDTNSASLKATTAFILSKLRKIRN